MLGLVRVLFFGVGSGLGIKLSGTSPSGFRVLGPQPPQIHHYFQVMRERDVSLGRQIGITDMNPEQQSIQVTIYFLLKYVDHRINVAVSDSNIQVNITYHSQLKYQIT